MKFPELRKQIISLSNLPEGDSPIISAYFDLINPAISLHERFSLWKKQMSTTFEGDTGQSVALAADRIQEWLLSGADGAKGAAIFAREGEVPFFLPITFQVKLDDYFYVGDRPAIFPLIELKDRFNRFVVVLTTQELARIMEINLGETSLEMLTERPAVRERHGREWTREHYINHCRDRDRKFLKEKVAIIEQLMAKRGHNALVLAGEARYVTWLHQALPKHLQDKVIDHIRTGISDERVHDVLEEAITSYLEAEKEQSESAVKRLFRALRTSGLATLGVQPTLAALRSGQADELVVSSLLDHDARERLVRIASQHGVPIETVRDSQLLDQQGGAGALLRYRYDPNVAAEISSAA